MLNQSKNLVKIIGIGDLACQIINMLFDAGIPNTDFFVCHSESEILENSEVPGKIKLNEDLKNSSGISINSDQNLKTLFQNTPPGMVFFLTDIKNEWNQDATTLLAQFANKKDQLTIAILPSPKAKGGYYTQWDTDPTGFIDAIFHFENNETNMNFGMPNSQKGMNKIHREFHSANNLTIFCTNEIVNYFQVNFIEDGCI